MTQKTRTYFCIDMKSFYASVECAERCLNPFETNLVVADKTRGSNALCLAITPKMKAQGVKNRCRLSEIPQNIQYEIAMPRMQLYIEYAADIYGLYLNYFDPQDIHVYSIDESFIDVTGYLDALQTDGYIDLSTAEVILSVRSTGMGLAVGKVAEEDSFDVGWPARFRENVQFDDNVVFSSVLWLANLIFPVGSIRMTVSAADASTFLGGTWVRWGTGRVPVGVNTSDANFNTVEKTGGASAQALSVAEMPSHNHSFSGSVTVNANGAHAHQASSGSYKVGSGSASTYYYMTNGGATSGQTTGSGGSHDHTGSVSGSVGSNGSGAAHNNLQPYITCYFWKRTA